MFDRVSDSSKLGLLVVGLAVVLAVPGVSGLLGCSNSGAGPGTGAGGAAGTGSGTGGGGASGTGGDGGSGTGGASGASGTAGAGGASGATGSGAAAGGVGGGAAGGGGHDAGSNPDGPPVAPTITMLTPSSAHVGDPGFTLVVEGHDFPPNPYVSFDGNIFNTTVVSATRLEASVPGAALGATPRQVSVLVTRIGGAAQSSNALPFQILAAQDGG